MPNDLAQTKTTTSIASFGDSVKWRLGEILATDNAILHCTGGGPRDLSGFFVPLSHLRLAGTGTQGRMAEFPWQPATALGIAQTREADIQAPDLRCLCPARCVPRSSRRAVPSPSFPGEPRLHRTWHPAACRSRGHAVPDHPMAWAVRRPVLFRAGTRARQRCPRVSQTPLAGVAHRARSPPAALCVLDGSHYNPYATSPRGLSGPHVPT